MRSAPYRLIYMAIEMAREVGDFFSVVDLMSCKTAAKRPVMPIKKNLSYTIVLYYVLVVRILWRPADCN
jgi:hypothetical protein